jgi:hypothetical protein
VKALSAGLVYVYKLQPEGEGGKPGYFGGPEDYHDQVRPEGHDALGSARGGCCM